MARPEKLTLFETYFNISQILLGHLILLAWFIYGGLLVSFPFYVFLSLIFSLIHQRVVSEWIHESAHFNLLTDKKANDFFTHVFLGFLFMNDIRTHRLSHFQHHRQNKFLTEEDPDTNFLKVKNRKDLLIGFLKDLTGINAVKMLLGRQQVNKDKMARNKMLYVFACAHLIFFAASLYLGFSKIYFIYYSSLVFLYPAINRIRSYGQHAEFFDGVGKAEYTSASRTFKTTLLGRIFIHSDLMKYHHEHHEYPQLPYRRLKALALAQPSDINQYSIGHFQIMSDLFKGLPHE